MLHTMKRGLFVGSAVAVIAALCSGSALAARGHAKFTPRAAAGMMGGFGPFARMGGGMGAPGFAAKGFGGPAFGRGFGGPGFGGPGFGGPGMRGPGMRGHGPGMGGGLLATGVLKTAADYLGITPTALQADLKGGKTLAEVANGTSGKSAAGLIKALTDDAKANLDAAVAAGWLTDAQATAVLDGVTKQVTALVNDGPPTPPVKRPGPLDAAAAYLGMTVADLKTALKGGKTLAQVVADKNDSSKTVDGLVAAMTADAKTKLDAAVTDKKITQAQEDAILKRLTQRVTNFVNGAHGPKAATTTTTTAIKNALKFTVRR